MLDDLLWRHAFRIRIFIRTRVQVIQGQRDTGVVCTRHLHFCVFCWAGKTIELGPGGRLTPWVLGPSNAPAITHLPDAEENVELAVLSAIEHGHSADVDLAARVASAAIVASAGIDAERSRLYLDLILISLPINVRGALQAMKMLGYEYMKSRGYDFEKEFERFQLARAKAAGRTEGREEMVLKQLARRFGPLSEEVRSRVHGADEEQLDALAEQLLTAQSLEEALIALS
jgi:uncharacterized protein DUF4351